MGITSLSSGISGLKASQAALNVIGDNLANLNTPGFKSSRVLFASEFSQTLQNAQAPTSNVGGKNPIQVGTGVSVGSIDTNFTQGSITPTGRALDVAIAGEGFFVLTTDDGSSEFYTRVGAFGLDKNNDLVDTNTGLKVKGSLGPINIDVNAKMEASATTSVTLSGNLDSGSDSGSVAQVVTSAASFYNGAGVTASAVTTLNDLGANTIDYLDGDEIIITGMEANGTSISETFTYGTAAVGDGTTLGELSTFISANFGTATSAITADGEIELTGDSVGGSNLKLSFSDGTSNTGATSWPSTTTSVTGAGDVYVTTITVVDQQGKSIPITLTFNKSADNTWALTPTMQPDDGSVTVNVTDVNFNTNGSYGSSTLVSGSQPNITITFNDALSTQQTIVLDFGIANSFDGLSQLSGSSSAAAISQDGFGAGFYASSTINSDGTITTLFTNGQTETGTAQIVLASFSNPSGLSKSGDNLYIVTVASGEPVTKTPGSGLAGNLVSGSLESSNVDIAEEFTNLIISQRAFQANARTITTTDEVLQELVNIVR